MWGVVADGGKLDATVWLKACHGARPQTINNSIKQRQYVTKMIDYCRHGKQQ